MAQPPEPPSVQQDQDAQREERRRKLGEWGKHAGHGMQYAITIAVFALIGWRLDLWLGTGPWLLLLLLLLGFVGATVSLVKSIPLSSSPPKR